MTGRRALRASCSRALELIPGLLDLDNPGEATGTWGGRERALSQPLGQ